MIFRAKYANEINNQGDTRIKRVFAYLPFRIHDDIVWLETYEVKQAYIMSTIQALNDEGTKMVGYLVGEWKNLSYRRIPKITINIKEK